MKMVEIGVNLKAVRDKILAACAKRPREYNYFEPRLVAVSKLKPPELIIQAYEGGLKHFGENYVNELVEKANNPNILEKCKEIRWHFIGHLQRNKVNRVLSIPNLYIIETVDNEKLAATLHNSWPKFRKVEEEKLKVMIQINTSKEEEKSGCAVENVCSFVKYVIDHCQNLEFVGLMTIGMFGYDLTKGPNPDFLCLKECRNEVSKELNIDPTKIELSMGMSNDFEHAIEQGSTNVRVGSAIFGERPKKET
ncbi:pyridoxal phosphate homeostasis protein [Osmia bicornis bicornis]|uniref:pyridoxal phosphate homeostasis protein n=1 Tax=Osmia bicornis bicornis TaxID=1437191 RepID=UPI0010F93F69|nr:pyridoxal phosphate homeostasis protein [Osmia bicornis bicornis]XP_046142952.1 pyridoxal phosphate homeostasis protein [Osmia bicornis bicornis]XP_046142953.1 pyridoxal phosphate homeostasis protein [Osmia bicornis bicornis]